MLEGGQLLCTAGLAKIEGNEVKVFSSPCQSCFKVLSGIQEVADLFCGAAISEEVCSKSSVVEVFCSGEEGSKSRINCVKHSLDPTR